MEPLTNKDLHCRGQDDESFIYKRDNGTVSLAGRGSWLRKLTVPFSDRMTGGTTAEVESTDD